MRTGGTVNINNVSRASQGAAADSGKLFYPPSSLEEGVAAEKAAKCKKKLQNKGTGSSGGGLEN